MTFRKTEVRVCALLLDRRSFLGLGGFRQGVDDFVGAGVVEALSCFVFDGAGVGFQAVYVLAQAGVLCCELFDFLGESLVFGPLLLPACEAIAAVDYVPGEEQGEEDCRNRADAATVAEVFRPPALREGRGLGFGGFGHILISG